MPKKITLEITLNEDEEIEVRQGGQTHPFSATFNMTEFLTEAYYEALYLKNGELSAVDSMKAGGRLMWHLRMIGQAVGRLEMMPALDDYGTYEPPKEYGNV